MQRGHSHLSVTATSEVEVGSPKRPGQVADVPWEEAAEVLCHDLDPERLEARQFILDSPLCEAAADITQYAAVSLRPGGLLLESVAELSARIHGDFAYVPGFTSVTTPLSVVLEHRRGVCQDFAHLAIACLRAHGLAARYVSGYLETRPHPVKTSSSAPTPRMPGSPSTTPVSAGSTSTPPTTTAPKIATSPSPGGGITAT